MEAPSHYCHVTSYLRTCHSWMIEDEVIHCTNNQSPIEIVALCGLLSYLPSFLSTPILTLYPGPGPHHFSLATLFHCPDASPSGQTSGAQPSACSPCVWSTGQMQSPGWEHSTWRDAYRRSLWTRAAMTFPLPTLTFILASLTFPLPTFPVALHCSSPFCLDSTRPQVTSRLLSFTHTPVVSSWRVFLPCPPPCPAHIYSSPEA